MREVARTKANTSNHILSISLKPGTAINGFHELLLNNHPKNMYVVETIYINFTNEKTETQRG